MKKWTLLMTYLFIIYFHRKLLIFKIEKSFDNVFQLKNEVNQKVFIDFCELMYKNKMNQDLDKKVQTKIKKKVSFNLSTKR